MGIYKLERQQPNGKAVRGTIYDEKGIAVVPTLENLDYIIPTGMYKIVVTISPRFGYYMPLLTNVPGRTGIRIHGGTKPSHSQGCVLITHRKKYQDFVRHLLQEQETAAPIYIEITDN